MAIPQATLGRSFYLNTVSFSLFCFWMGNCLAEMPLFHFINWTQGFTLPLRSLKPCPMKLYRKNGYPPAGHGVALFYRIVINGESKTTSDFSVFKFHCTLHMSILAVLKFEEGSVSNNAPFEVSCRSLFLIQYGILTADTICYQGVK